LFVGVTPVGIQSYFVCVPPLLGSSVYLVQKKFQIIGIGPCDYR